MNDNDINNIPDIQDEDEDNASFENFESKQNSENNKKSLPKTKQPIAVFLSILLLVVILFGAGFFVFSYASKTQIAVNPFSANTIENKQLPVSNALLVGTKVLTNTTDSSSKTNSVPVASGDVINSNQTTNTNIELNNSIVNTQIADLFDQLAEFKGKYNSLAEQINNISNELYMQSNALNKVTTAVNNNNQQAEIKEIKASINSLFNLISSIKNEQAKISAQEQQQKIATLKNSNSYKKSKQDKLLQKILAIRSVAGSVVATVVLYDGSSRTLAEGDYIDNWQLLEINSERSFLNFSDGNTFIKAQML